MMRRINANILGLLGQQGTNVNQVPFQADLRFHSSERSGLSLVDELGNNATLIPSATDFIYAASPASNPGFNTGILPAENTIMVTKAQLKSAISGTNIASIDYWGIIRAGTNTIRLQYAAANAGSVSKADGPYLFILYNKRLWIRPVDTDDSDASILNIIATVAPDITTANNLTTTTTTVKIFSNTLVSTLFMGSIIDGVITWQQKQVFNNTSHAINLLNNDVTLFTTIGNSNYGKEVAFPNGYSKFLDDGYKYISGDAKYHNLANSFISFTNAIFDKSDALIYKDYARSSVYYDAANPKRWHISELDRSVLNSYLQADYYGRIFVKVTDNSYSDRKLLKEVLVYTTNKTGADFNSVLTYCGDTDVNNYVYVHSPYDEVFKVTAVTDSVFKFNFNKNLVYSYDELATLISGMPDLYTDEPIFLKVARYFSSRGNPSKLPLLDTPIKYKIGYNPILWNNSFNFTQCGGSIAVNLINKLFSDLSTSRVWGTGVAGHVFTDIPSKGMFDITKKKLLMKTKTIAYDTAEINSNNEIC